MKWFYCLVIVWAFAISQGQTVSEFEGKSFEVFNVVSEVSRENLIRAHIDVEIKRYCSVDRAYRVIELGDFSMKQYLNINLKPMPFSNTVYNMEISGFAGIGPAGSSLYIVSKCHPLWDTISVIKI